ncbi:MAG: hypothetical protein ACTS5I_10600, partial [Rhodanobacter sp.]
DPKHTKGFTRGGGFKGTATNATYLARKATEHFGPCGTGWGINVISEEVFTGAPHLNSEGHVIAHDMIHKVHARLWYVIDGTRGEVEQFGQTQIVGKNKNGFYTDEEAPKKSLTDAMSKCLSLLGFSADIHLGLYDDNKYVASLQAEFAPRVTEDQAASLRDLIAASNADEAGFLAYFGADAIDHVPASRYAEAKTMLERKVKQAA